jgi:hypothetical protein
MPVLGVLAVPTQFKVSYKQSYMLGEWSASLRYVKRTATAYADVQFGLTGIDS